MLLEADLTPAQLQGTLSDLLDGTRRSCGRWRENARSLAHPDAAQRIARMAHGAGAARFPQRSLLGAGKLRDQADKTRRPAPKSRPFG